MKSLLFKHSLIFFLIVASVYLSSCCPKVDCLGADGLYDIEFVNFAQKDLDTIVLKQFEKNSDFTSPTKSSTIITTPDMENPVYVSVILPNTISTDHDYRVLLVSTGQVFTLTDFEVKKENCSSNVWCNNQYNALSKYKVNGISQSLGRLRISQ